MHRLYFLILSSFCLIHLNSSDIFTCDPNASCGCSLSSASITAKIVGGEAASDGAWGWTLQLLQSGTLTCAAVLISNSYALTAAHCVPNGTIVSQLSIIAGTNSLYNPSGSGQQREIIEYYVHPNFDFDRGTNDIAVLHFSPLTVSSTVKFICLPSANVDPYTVGSNAVAVGWGVTNENSSDPSPNLLQVTVQIEASGSVDCRNGQIKDANVQLCAGVPNGGKDSCFGDSGGPLMVFTGSNWVLAGLTSNGEGCARAGFPGIYTRVSVFISFINYVINFSGVTGGSTAQTSSSSSSTAGITTAAKNTATNLEHFLYNSLSYFLFILINISLIIN